MKMKIPDLQTRLKLISVIILVVGLGCATWIYQRAEMFRTALWVT